MLKEEKLKHQVKFGVMTDLHHGLMHDAPWRLSIFLDSCLEKNVDFIIQLGDFCDYQLSETQQNAVVIPYNKFPRPSYHVLGNHDMDLCSKEEILKLLGSPSPYYSFDCNGYHFIVLDCNYYFEGGTYLHYCNGNYKKEHEYDCYLPLEELQWLEEDLKMTSLPTILFSHQCLKEEVHGLNNGRQLRQIIQRSGKKVKLAINGHNHMDDLQMLEEVLYMNLNSISNQWLGEEYSTKRYGKPYDKKFPCLKMTAPYQDPLFAIITADEKSIDIQGVESKYVGKSPYELHYPFNRFWREGAPRVSSHFIIL